MPLHYCHPSAPHKKLKLPEWYVSDLMLERVLDAIIRRLKKLDREHDIPYLAGYNIDGTIITSTAICRRRSNRRAEQSKQTASSSCMKKWRKR
jgi:hypothetical protein